MQCTAPPMLLLHFCQKKLHGQDMVLAYGTCTKSSATIKMSISIALTKLPCGSARSHLPPAHLRPHCCRVCNGCEPGLLLTYSGALSRRSYINACAELAPEAMLASGVRPMLCVWPGTHQKPWLMRTRLSLAHMGRMQPTAPLQPDQLACLQH